MPLWTLSGGERGIRTLGTALTVLSAYKAGAFSRSAISPIRKGPYTRGDCPKGQSPQSFRDYPSVVYGLWQNANLSAIRSVVDDFTRFYLVPVVFLTVGAKTSRAFSLLGKP